MCMEEKIAQVLYLYEDLEQEADENFVYDILSILVREYNINKLKVVYSREKPLKPLYSLDSSDVVKKNIPGEHFLEGSIKTGDHVLFSKHVFIDYSGEVIIDDHAKLANGVIIETHYRDMEAYDKGKDVNIPTKLHICERAYIGSRAMILSSCHYIGKHARVGAGAVVTKDVPDYATVVGVPAKVVKVNASTIPTETN